MELLEEREGWDYCCVETASLRRGLGTTLLATHPDELMVTLITELLQHLLSLGQSLLSTLGLLQLHVQGGHQATCVTLYPLQAAGFLFIHQVMQLLELSADHPAEDIGLILRQGGPVTVQSQLTCWAGGGLSIPRTLFFWSILKGAQPTCPMG